MQSPPHYQSLPEVVRLCASITQLLSADEALSVEVQSLAQLLGYFERMRALNEGVLELEELHLRDVSRLVRRCHGTLLSLQKYLERERERGKRDREGEGPWGGEAQEVKAARFYIGFYRRALEMALVGFNL